MIPDKIYGKSHRAHLDRGDSYLDSDLLKVIWELSDHGLGRRPVGSSPELILPNLVGVLARGNG